MEIRCHQFKKRSREALSDTHLQKALKNVETRLAADRNAAFAALENSEALRDRAHRIKQNTLDRLDEHLVRLEEKITHLGGTVHWADTAGRARAIIESLAINRGVRSVVKGKSMVTEEISLNEGLIQRGIEVSETDLGEFIIQLAGEPPSHLVGPAIHKTKEQVSELFAQKLGAKGMEDPGEMTLFARETLRHRFLDADMGITGANFAVAETGTIVLFENEGNIRLTTTLPKIHVAVMGIEKVVPTLDDLGVLMKLLARSCTGQKLSSYVSMISGPKGGGEGDGPEEFHLVILDNGRSRILEDDDLREILYCIRCGACLNFCPVYMKIGGHAYGWVYSGPIGSILTPQLINKKQAYLLPYASTLCGACAEVCPVNINHPKVLVALRKKYMEDPQWENASPPGEGLLFALAAGIMGNKRLYEGASGLARLIRKTFPRKGRARHLLQTLDPWGRSQQVEALSRETFRKQWRELSKSGKGSRHG
ncbi:MAG: iron-sulfur cluster-binding protein [Deltaproteobacteria bacterium]|nr:iron-sulfur cluster-binding protein [Deltaproteobacteria bacterium]